MLRALEKVDNMQEQMATKGKTQKEILEMKNAVKKRWRMPLIDASIDWTQQRKRISKLEEMSIETSKTEMPREKKNEKNEKNIKSCGTITKGVTYA